jgi:hypothetical protein
MKIIAETKIGSREKYYNYHNNGVAGIFINKDNAVCRYCSSAFQFNPKCHYEAIEEISCPICSRHYKKSEIMFSSVYDSYLPYVAVFKILEMKTKIKLKICYTAIQIKDIQSYPNVYDIKEVFTFDIKNSDVIWEKYKDNKLMEKREIGYITDYEQLREYTALWFFHIKHNIKSGLSLNNLLKILRDRIQKKEKLIHNYTKKSLYVANVDLKHKFFANALNLAHKVRFWDSENIIYNNNFLRNKSLLLDNFVDVNFEKSIYILMTTKNISYHKACFEYLSLPYTKTVLKNFSYDNIFLLQLIYKVKDINIANFLFSYYKSWLNSLSYIDFMYNFSSLPREIKTICDFYNLFVLKIYKHLQPCRLIENKQELIDIMNLWYSANNKTKKNFIRYKIPFKKLHDWLSIEVSKQVDQEISFHISKDVINRFNFYMMNTKFQCSCINKYSKLKYIAKQMKNCSAGYKDRINKSIQLVVISDDTGKPKVLLEINRDSIVQAKQYRNVPVFRDNLLNDLVIKFAQTTKLEIATADVYMKQDTKLKCIA